MNEDNSGTPVTPELIEAIKDSLAHDETPRHSEDVYVEADVNAPTDPTVYTETDPNDTKPEVAPGDPGTYAGDYERQWDNHTADIEDRNDLPEGYTPGSFTGEYRSI